jgi:uncharacterized membrane protein
MRGLCSGAAAALLFVATTANAAVPSFMGIRASGGTTATWMEPTTVSADGNTVFGIYVNGSNWDTFRWSRTGGFTPLNIPQLANSEYFHGGASDDAGVLAGSYMGTGGDHAYRLPAGGSKQILTPLVAGGSADARGISGDGSVIVGRSATVISGQGYHSMAYRWTQQTGMVALGFRPGGSDSVANAVSNDGTVIVGSADSGAAGNLAFRWTQAGGYQMLGDIDGGATSSRALDISDDNLTIVGTGAPAGGGSEAFRWTPATGLVPLGDLSGGDHRSYPFGVSADGSIIVGYGGTTNEAGSNVSRAVIWDENGLRRLDDVLTGMGIDLTGWILSSARAITPDGNTIIGYGQNPAGQADTWIAVIPEPSGAALLLLAAPYVLRRRPR